VDGLGVLQVLLQFMQHPEAQEIITHVDYPTVDNLRHAGMVETWLGVDYVGTSAVRNGFRLSI
jgi:hypothetical protein